MIKRLKEFFEFVVSLMKAWPYLLLVVGYLSSVIAVAIKFSSATVNFSIPRLVLVTVVSFALYPIVKFVETLMRRKEKKNFLYKGLLWKLGFFSFQHPTPICPKKDCGRKVFIKSTPKISITTISGPFLQANSEYDHTYECPIHGSLDVPNLPIRELQEKAKLSQK